MSEPTVPQGYFATRYRFDSGRSRVWRAVCEHLQRYVPRPATVVDLGAGYCDFINQIAAAERYAVDRDPQVRGYCALGVTFLQADVSALPLPDRSVGVAFASNLLEHLTDERLRDLFRELERVLKDGGRLILVQPNYYYCYRRYWDDFTHVKAWSHESLPDLLSGNGYTVERVDKRFLPFSFRSRLPSSYRLTRLYLGLPWRPWAGQMLVVARRGGARVAGA